MEKKRDSKNWLKISAIIVFVLAFSVIGMKLTIASFAARPTGTLQVITYEGSVTAGREIGSVNIYTDQGGSTVQCSPRGGTTDPAGGGNHGKLHLTCGSALDGGPLTYVFLGAQRDGYSISPNSPHQPGETFHIRANQTTTFSIVLDGPPPPNAPPQESPKPTPNPTPQPAPASKPETPAPATAPDGELDIITYENSVKSGNEIGGVHVTTDQGGSGVQCNNRSGITDPDDGKNHGHVHITCPAAANGGPRTYKISSVERPDFEISESSPHKIGDAFHISGNKTTTLSLVLKRTKSNESQDSSKPKTPKSTPVIAAPEPIKPTQPTVASNVGRISVIVYRHNEAGQPINSARDEKVSGVYVKAVNIGVGTNLQCPDDEQRTGSENNTSNPLGKVIFANCPVATATADNHAKKYQVSISIPSGYEVDSSFNNSVGAEKQGNSIIRTITVRKNQTTDVSFILVKPKTDETISLNSNSLAYSDSSDPIAEASKCIDFPCKGSSNSNSRSVRERVVDIARRELRADRTETRQLQFMNADYGPGNGALNAYDPWCAFFVSYVYKKAGVTDPLRHGCSGQFGLWAKSRGSWHPVRGPGAEPNYKPRSGDAMIFSKGSGVGGLVCPISTHIGLVTKVYSNGKFDSIHGNLSDQVFFAPGLTKYSSVNGGQLLGFASPLKDD